MKKIVMWIGLVGMLSTMMMTQVQGAEINEESSVGVTSKTEEINDVEAIEITSRARVKCIQFKSKPPKKYKCLSLIKEQKNKKGYLGYYV